MSWCRIRLHPRGAYFITICTYEREHLFGQVVDGQMVLNPLGEIVRDEWFRFAVAGFKSAVTKRINEHRDAPGAPVWQRNYHEYTIRNDRALSAIREYTQNDPLHWHLDRYNPDSTGSDPRVREFGWILYG